MTSTAPTLWPAILVLLLTVGCTSAPTATPSVSSTDAAASTASQPEPSEQPATGGGGNDGGQGQGGGSKSSGEDGSGGGADQAADSSGQPSAGEETEPAAASVAPTGPSTSSERAAELDRDLEESLAEFDGMLVREQQALEDQRQEAAESSSAGGYAGREGRSASTLPTDGEATGRSGGGAAGASRQEAGEETLDEETQGRIPADVGDGADDDIVARQLREAAINEKDPELREKLWDEYRKYKGLGEG